MNDFGCIFIGTIFHLLYADDLHFYFSFPFHLLQYYLTLMSQFAELALQWSTKNNLRLNVAKTETIIIGSYYYINKLSQHEIEEITLISIIKFESSVKSLGVIIDCKLDWKQQVSAICKRSNSLMYRLNFFRKSTAFKLQKHLIESLLFPLIVYFTSYM